MLDDKIGETSICPDNFCDSRYYRSKNYISSVEKMVKADGSPLFAKSRFRQMASVFYINFWAVCLLLFFYICQLLFYFIFAFRQGKSKISLSIPAGSDHQ
jgi:hypothetical protein